MRFKTLLTAFMILCLISSALWALPNQKYQSSKKTSLVYDVDTYLDINSLLCFIYNDGNFAYDNANIMGHTDGLYYPRGSDKRVIYSAGLWMGAKVNDSLRLAVAEFSSEFVPGPMVNGTYVTDNPDFKVYKINRGDTPQNNPDYANWPIGQGAPVDDYGNPLLQGDQMCWSVYNDADSSVHHVSPGGTLPLGIEVQQTSFAYDRMNQMGNVIFLKFLIINKGGNSLEDTYISLWCDPDLGGASDDLVGCDTDLSLGYCYNDVGVDQVYGTVPPAVGFDFFQGPIVETGNPNDSAKYMGEWRVGFKNLPMTSFNRYINGTDPHASYETYNYMKGLYPDGQPVEDPEGHTTKFWFPGDPVTGTGWLDENSSDRRFMMSSGPFNMEPGDTQEVVAAILVGQGANRLASITDLRNIDVMAQQVFDLNFDIPVAPESFPIYARSYDQAIELIWESTYESDYMDYMDFNNEFFAFEGYNVYQGENPYGPWHKIATFDLTANQAYQTFHEVAGDSVIKCYGAECDTMERVWDFRKIYNYVYDPDVGGIELKIVQKGNETGVQNKLMIEEDYINGGELVNGHMYYYSVNPYYLNIQQVWPEDSVFLGYNFLGFNMATIENEPYTNSLSAYPTSAQGEYTITADHVAGYSSGEVEVEILNPNDIIAGDYQVTFNMDDTWNLDREGMFLLTDQENQSGDYNYPVVDGIMTRVKGPVPGVGEIVETQYAGTPVNPPDNVFWSYNSTMDYYVSSDFDGSSQQAKDRLNWLGRIEWESWEFRFTSTGSEYYNWMDDQKFPDRAPFEVWHYSENDSEPDRRDFFFVLDDDESGGWSVGDRIYIAEREYPTEPLPQDANDTGYDWPNEFHLGRVIFNESVPPEGTIVRVNSTIPNAVDDVFQFTLASPEMCGDANSDLSVDISDAVFIINYVFLGGPPPNPYKNGDANCDGEVTISDAVYLIAFLFGDGNPPCDTNDDGIPDC